MAWFFRSAEWLQHFYYYWKSLLPKVSATSLTVEWWTSAQILWQVNCPLTKQLNFKANLMGIRLGVGVGLLFQPSEEADFLHVSCWCLHSEGTCSHVPIVWSIQEKCFLQLKKAAVSTSAKKKTSHHRTSIKCNPWLSIWHTLYWRQAAWSASRPV